MFRVTKLATSQRGQNIFALAHFLAATGSASWLATSIETDSVLLRVLAWVSTLLVVLVGPSVAFEVQDRRKAKRK